MNHSNTISLELPAAYKYLNIIGACVRAILEREIHPEENGNDRVAYQIELAVQEACTNIIEHAYAGGFGKIQVFFTMNEQNKRLTIDLFDTGTHFEPSQLAPVDLDSPQTSGYGLFLINQLMEKVTYYQQPEGNHWRLEKKF
jgi:serine/threonine-protein kinase RsbW